MSKVNEVYGIVGLFDPFEYQLVLDSLSHYSRYLKSRGFTETARYTRKLLQEMRASKHTDTLYNDTTDNLTNSQPVAKPRRNKNA